MEVSINIQALWENMCCEDYDTFLPDCMDYTEFEEKFIRAMSKGKFKIEKTAFGRYFVVSLVDKEVDA